MSEYIHEENLPFDGLAFDGTVPLNPTIEPHRTRRQRVAVTVGIVSTVAGGISACGPNNDSIFSASTTYYGYSHQRGDESVFYGCGPGGGLILDLHDIEQTSPQQLEEASVGQGGKCILTIPAGNYTPEDGAVYSYNKGQMTNLYHCNGSKSPIMLASNQPSDQPYVEQSPPLTYKTLQDITVKIQQAHGDTKAIESIFAHNLGISTPFYNEILKQNAIQDLSVTYPVSPDDATASGQEGKDWTLASNLIDATDAPFQLNNAGSVNSTVPLGTGDSPFYVTAFYAPKDNGPAPTTTPSPCATSHYEADGHDTDRVIKIHIGGAALETSVVTTSEKALKGLEDTLVF